MTSKDIAIIGMACRFPGAEGLDEFWDLLTRGGDGVSEIPPSRWQLDAFFDPDPHKAGYTAFKSLGTLSAPYDFDWRAFGIPPRQARQIDPQHRLLMELTWEALDDAGLPFDAVAGTRVGVWVAMMFSDYYNLMCMRPESLDVYSAWGNESSAGANRISNVFDLRGPSLALQGSCCSSHIAIHYACSALRSGEASLALVGGVGLNLSPTQFVSTSKAGILSPSGRARAFDARADGTVLGDGAGMLVLKSMERALADGDRIYAVVLGSALNHNGHTTFLMGTDGRAQVDLYRAAYAAAEVDPRRVGYVELHGTGTRQGDPVEAAALGQVVGKDRDQPCRVGSVKTNIGHSGAAAGMAQVVKVALSMFHGQLPPSLHHENTNPQIDLSALSLRVQGELSAWPQPPDQRIAGVTGLSLGGVNAHVVMKGVPEPRPETALAPGEVLVLPISARGTAALEAYCAAWYQALAEKTPEEAASMCHAAAVRRTHHRYRRAVTGSGPQELAKRLSNLGSSSPQDKDLGLFLAPMTEPAEAAVRALAIGPDGTALRTRLQQVSSLRREPEPSGTNALVALGSLLREFGVRPTVVVAIGEGAIAAAVSLGVMSLEQACTASHDELAEALCDGADDGGYRIAVGATQDGPWHCSRDAGSFAGNEISSPDLLLSSIARKRAWDLRALSRRSADYGQSGAPTPDWFFDILADAYTAGDDIDWAAVLPRRGHCRVSLPRYPWQRQHLVVPSVALRRAPARAAVHDSVRMPLFEGRGVVSPTQPGSRSWVATIDPRSYPSLAQHARNGDIVVAGAALLLMVTDAVARSYGRTASLSDVHFERPVVLAGGTSSAVQLVATEDGRSTSFILYSAGATTATRWTAHMRGSIVKPEAGA